MSQFTEWRDEVKADAAAWWAGSPMVRGFAYGFAAGGAVVVALWVVFS